MRPISPNTGAPERVFAENQEEYLPLSVAEYEHTDGTRSLVTAWVPKKEELDAMSQTLSKLMEKQPILLSPGHAYRLLADLFKAHPVFVMQLNWGGGMTPMMVTLGPQEWMLVGEHAPESVPIPPDTRFAITDEGREALAQPPTDAPPSDGDGPE